MSGTLKIAIGLAASCVLGVATLAAAAANPTFTTVYRFQGQPHNDGAVPFSALIHDRSGVFYGTTEYGSAVNACTGPFNFINGCGTVFKLVPPRNGGMVWHESPIYSFLGGSDGEFPFGGLVRDMTGALYGTTSEGGGGGSGYCGGSFCGTVYKLAPPASAGGVWTETIVYSFQGSADGANPLGALVFGPAGLYGMTTGGGDNSSCTDCGTVFQIASVNGTLTESVIYSFQGKGDGEEPLGALLVDRSGALFGTTVFGGLYDEGTLFKLAPANGGWQLATAYQFPGYLWSGEPRYGALLHLASGAMVGTTSFGGDPKCGYCGSVYMLTPPSAAVGHWTYQLLHRFNGTDGAQPQSGVVADAQGNLYGTAEFGGSRGSCGFSEIIARKAGSPANSSGCGTVFMLTKPPGGKGLWPATVLHNFSGGLDGGEPIGGLVADGKLSMIGTTISGGLGCPQNDGCGTIFVVKP